MADPRGFVSFSRRGPARRPVAERVRDWREVYQPFPGSELHDQAARCMDCGIPFCHEGCPLGNLIPEWNDLVWRGRFAEAAERLHATNNFPEFTGRLCPAPCEGSCVLGINSDPVTIKQVEVEIAEWAFANDAVLALTTVPTGKQVAVVGSGPSGLACAQQLARAGHRVVVYERAEKAGGLLRYGIPEFKMEKSVLDRRLAQLEAEGVEIRCSTSVGGGNGPEEVPGAGAPDVRHLPAAELRAAYDAVVLAGGATLPREIPVPGRELAGIHPAMEFLKAANLACEGSTVDMMDPASPAGGDVPHAAGKRVVIIGGGDTGADCLGTAHRQGAASVQQLEILPEPPEGRASDNPWPTWPLILRTSSAHEEGGERLFAVTTTAFLGDEQGRVRALTGHEVRPAPGGGFEAVPDTDFELPCELVLLAMGFLGPERTGVLAELGVEVDQRGNVACDDTFMTTADGVFACGDMQRGQSLIVWAIAEGRSAAAAVDSYLTGDTTLPAPITRGQLAIR
ncbi:MAG TPA: glutamate synthase subunit beta [Acidimicrobiales bacterium]|nr:glutamate synthase subunit beta [Acidimicrobiales bacterium]